MKKIRELLKKFNIYGRYDDPEHPENPNNF